VSVYLDTQGATDAPWDQFYGWQSCGGFLACDGGVFEPPVERDTDVSSGAWLGRRPPDVLPSTPGDNGGFRGYTEQDYVESTGDEIGDADLAGFDSVLSERWIGRAIEPNQWPVILSSSNKNTDDRVEVLRTLVTFTEPGVHRVMFKKRDASVYDTPDLMTVAIGLHRQLSTIDTIVWVDSEASFMRGIAGNRDPVIHGRRFKVMIDEVLDQQGDVVKIRLLRDVNHNGRLDPHDELVGKDKYGLDGWAISALSDSSWGTARTWFFAEAVDAARNRSNVLAIQTDVIAPGVPYIQELTTDMPVNHYHRPFKLTARGVVDTDGSITEVRFYHDSDRNGELDASDELVGVQTESPGVGFTVRVDWNGDWPHHDVVFFAQAIDDMGNVSLSKSIVVNKTFSYARERSVCPADRNGDGWVGATDLALFLNAYAEKSPSADVDGLPGVDQLDLIAYIKNWDKGCD